MERKIQSNTLFPQIGQYVFRNKSEKWSYIVMTLRYLEQSRFGLAHYLELRRDSGPRDYILESYFNIMKDFGFSEALTLHKSLRGLGLCGSERGHRWCEGVCRVFHLEMCLSQKKPQPRSHYFWEAENKATDRYLLLERIVSNFTNYLQRYEKLFSCRSQAGQALPEIKRRLDVEAGSIGEDCLRELISCDVCPLRKKSYPWCKKS